jgi:hypothetical protein
VKEEPRQEDRLHESTRTAEDWLPQFTIEAQRAAEYVELFEALGNEVRLEKLDVTHMPDEGCSTCLMADCDRMVMIYTRRRRTEAEA